MIKNELNRYDTYGDSGSEWIERVPIGWKKKRLKDLIERLESGVSVNATDSPIQEGENGILKTSCVSMYTFNPSKNKTIWSSEISRAKSNPRKGNIIVSRMNTPKLVGASGYIDKDYPELFLPDRLWQTVFYHNVKLDSKWLSYFLIINRLREVFSFSATGTSPSMKNLGQESFLGIGILFPPLEEQKAIADYLDTKTIQIDRKIDLLTQKAIKYGNLKQSLINETVTRGLDKTVAMKDSGVEWILEVPKHWEVKRFKELGFLYSGLSGKKGDDFTDEHEFSSNFIPFVNIANNQYISTTDMKKVIVYPNEKQNKVKQNDLFFLMSSENHEDIGKASLLKVDIADTYLNSFCRGFRFTRKDIVANFINYLLTSKEYRNIVSVEGKGFTRINLKIEKINDLLLIIPTYEEQKAIADYLDIKTAHIDCIIETINTQIDKLKELRKTLINDVVTGKIKVYQE